MIHVNEVDLAKNVCTAIYFEILSLHPIQLACIKLWHCSDRWTFYAVPPKVLHYGLDWKIGKTGYEFDKHWFYDFDALMCPPWNLTDRSKGGLFQHPPHPDLYPTKVLIFLITGSCLWLADLRQPSRTLQNSTAISHMHQHACKASDAG